MENYSSQSIKTILSKIGGSEGTIVLPSIQRHFVWRPDRIAKLFDSIMQGFPIGTFMFWEVPDVDQKKYAFYEFIKHFSEFDNNNNAPTSSNLPKGIIGVLDGQQRLNSMYVALAGRYEEFNGRKGAWRTKRENFQEKEFHINVLAEPDEDDSWRYEFKFLSNNELLMRNKRPGELWIKAGAALYWDEAGEAIPVFEEASQEKEIDDDQRAYALERLVLLHATLNKPEQITAYMVRGKNLSEALEIFFRANRGGITLTPMDLYFSTIAAHWREGRNEVVNFLKEINKIGDFDYEISSLVLACLTLADGPIQLNVESFGQGHVKNIEKNWPQIKDHMREAAKLLNAWSFSKHNRISIHAGLPVAMAHRAGYDMRGSAAELRKLVIRSLVSDFYTKGTSRRNKVLTEIRKFMASDAATNRSFSLDRLMKSIELPAGINFHVNDETIEELLETQIWKPKAFLLLSLLHGQHALHQTYFDKDHIHPQNGFNKLGELNLSDEEKHRWWHLKDQLPNLQLLQGGDNRSKKDAPFEVWLSGFKPDEQQRTRYLDENDIPVDMSLKFADFPQLFEKRKDLLRKKLISILGSSPQTQSEVLDEPELSLP